MAAGAIVLDDDFPRWRSQMYDDYNGSGWTLGDADGALHLCPECRDLLYDVVSLSRRGPATLVQDPPDWVAAMNWLDSHCGSRQAVLTLDAAPLRGPVPAAPTGLEPEQLERYGAVAELLDATSERFFDGRGGEIHLALRRGLALTVERRPSLLRDERPVRLALGVIWAVGKANGLLHPIGMETEKTIREFLGSDAGASAVGKKVQLAIRSVYAWAGDDRPGWRWPSEAAGLVPLGQPGLLTARARSRLLEVRERALQAMATEPWPPRPEVIPA